MTPNHGKPWRLRNAASRDLGTAAVGGVFFHSLSAQPSRNRIIPSVEMCRCPLGAPLGSRGSLFHAVKEPQLPSGAPSGASIKQWVVKNVHKKQEMDG